MKDSSRESINIIKTMEIVPTGAFSVPLDGLRKSYLNILSATRSISGKSLFLTMIFFIREFIENYS
jgi:hypothetical protein